jgi:hypothetical protein
MDSVKLEALELKLSLALLSAGLLGLWPTLGGPLSCDAWIMMSFLPCHVSVRVWELECTVWSTVRSTEFSECGVLSGREGCGSLGLVLDTPYFCLP